MATDKYDLKVIEFESWNDALDEYNRSKAQLKDISFQKWYEQQISYIEFKKQQNEKESEELNDQQETILGVLSDLFMHFKQNSKDYIDIDQHYEIEDEDEDDLFSY